MLLPTSGPAGAAYVTMVDNGPVENRVNIVFLGDGYREEEIESAYVDHINGMLGHMFDDGEEPFVRYRNFFNVHRINVISNESGADIPADNIYRDTALDATYSWGGGVDRLLYVNTGLAAQKLNAGLAGAPFRADMQLVAVNEDRYGGGGGDWAVYAGGNNSAPELALHELGHAFSNLADEYGGHSSTRYYGSEPSQVNVTKTATGKWDHWIGYVQPGIGTIDAYEGARYYDRGLYRPSQKSKMRALGVPFDAVAREKIIHDIYDIVDPLDDWLDAGSDLIDPETLWVDPIDPELLQVDWLVDGTPVVADGPEAIGLAALGLDVGRYAITAQVFDPTDWVRVDPGLLSQSITWTVEVTVPVPEPTSWFLAAFSLVAALFARRRAF